MEMKKKIKRKIYLSIDMQTSTKLDKYRPNVRKNDIKRHIKSPAIHSTVYAHPISNGIIKNVTSKSAMAKCVSIASIRDGRLKRRRNNNTKTVTFPIDDNTIRMLYTRIDRRLPSLNVISNGNCVVVLLIGCQVLADPDVPLVILK